MRGSLRSYIPQGYSLSTQAEELSSLLKSLDNGSGSLVTSLGDLSRAVARSAVDAAAAGESPPQQLPQRPLSDAKDGSGERSEVERLAVVGTRSKPESLKVLRDTANRLHADVRRKREMILLLEEQESGAAERTRAAFDQIDINGDGELQWEEFVASATALLSAGEALGPSYKQSLRAQFVAADTDESSSLSYSECQTSPALHYLPSPSPTNLRPEHPALRRPLHLPPPALPPPALPPSHLPPTALPPSTACPPTHPPLPPPSHLPTFLSTS